jgi:hypothetical protein
LSSFASSQAASIERVLASLRVSSSSQLFEALARIGAPRWGQLRVQEVSGLRHILLHVGDSLRELRVLPTAALEVGAGFRRAAAPLHAVDRETSS